MVCRRSISRTKHEHRVYSGSKQGIHSHVQLHIGLHESSNSYMEIYVVLLRHLQSAGADTYLFLLTIILVICGRFCDKKRVKRLRNLKNSRQWWKEKQGHPSRCFKPTYVENLLQVNSKLSVKQWESIDTLPPLSLLSKME